MYFLGWTYYTCTCYARSTIASQDYTMVCHFSCIENIFKFFKSVCLHWFLKKDLYLEYNVSFLLKKTYFQISFLYFDL